MSTRDERIRRIQLGFIRASDPQVGDNDEWALHMYGEPALPLATAVYEAIEDAVADRDRPAQTVTDWSGNVIRTDEPEIVPPTTCFCGASIIDGVCLDGPWHTNQTPFYHGDGRLRSCVKAWPDCYSGGYDPACCRFPKSCSSES
jgi:hypothetical protein